MRVDRCPVRYCKILFINSNTIPSHTKLSTLSRAEVTAGAAADLRG